MRAERASLTDPPANKTQTTGLQGASSQLRIAERPAQSRVHHLVDLAFTLLREAEFLARDKSFVDETARLQSLDFAEGIDFYQEVERFEVGLIRRALEQTGGNQARAAKLLRIKPTTLNSKIKLYEIEF
jgi:transcriptional regulator with PAS, ATPase and Fis domain